jgi:hypothetical protein
VGANEPVRITSIDYRANRITLDRSISWNGDDEVNYVYLGSSPDRGAYESGASNEFNLRITSPTQDQSVSGRVRVQLEVTNPDAVRYVLFLVDGIPVATSYESPFTIEWDTAGWQNRVYTIEARAYARYASSNLWQGDQRIVTVLEQGAYPEGDVNRDGEVTLSDAQACTNHILGRQDWGDAADVNGDGAVNVLDVQRIVVLVNGD